MRVRKRGEDFTKTAKRVLSETQREEIEEFILEDEFNSLWAQTEGKRIEKTRYRIQYGEYIIELDVFDGKNKGLVLAEVELTSEVEMKNFKAPEWFGEDVTKNLKYKNKNLAG